MGTEIAGEKISYQDIGILYRSINRRAKTVMQVLAEEGIPVIFDGDAQQIETQEISIFLKLLNLIDNHKQDLPLLTVMHLPIFDFDLDDEAQIRSTYPDYVYFHESVEAYRDNEDDDLAFRLREFYDSLNKWRELSRHLEIDDFLWRLLLETGYYSFIGGLSGGKERKRNLRILLERAVSYKNSSLKGLSSFLQYVARLQKRGQTLSSAGKGADTEDAVHLMTIHKSKGLEFPVLFVADINRQFNTTSAGDLVYNKHVGYGARHLKIIDNVLVKNSTILLDAVIEQQRREEYSEEMRLLYVAMTRAKDRLYLVGSIDEEKLESKQNDWESGYSSENLLKKRSFLDWIMSALSNISINTARCSDSVELEDWKINFLPDRVDNTQMIEEKDNLEDDLSYQKLKQLIFKKMDQPVDELDRKIPIKLSVTHLKRYGVQNFEPVELVPLEEEKEDVFDYTEVGTAVHRILQMTDLTRAEDIDNLRDEVKDIKNRLLKRREITEEVYNQVDEELVIDFYTSTLGRRLIESFKESSGNVLLEMPFALDIRPNEVELLEEIEDRPIEIAGMIDACFLENDKWILIDYKTDRYYNDYLWNQRLEEYRVQIELYSKALEKLTGIEVGEKHIYFLSEKEDYLVD